MRVTKMRIGKGIIMSVFVGFSVAAMGEQLGVLTKGVGPDWMNSTQWAGDMKIGATLTALTNAAEGNGGGAVEGFTNLGAGDVYYGVFSDNVIRAADLAAGQYIGSWDLNGAYKNIIELRGENRTGYDVWAQRLAYSVEHGSDLVVEDSVELGHVSPEDIDPGCLGKYPLRYGDIDGDGKIELVLNLGYDWVVFSPAIHKVVFAGRWESLDFLTEDEIKSAEWTHDAPTDPQYVADSGLDRDIDKVVPARKGYAKFYLGDFDSNGKPDILMWRKAYQSRLNNDPLKGYQKIGDAVVQYERGDDGIYAPTNATSDTVKSWLVAKGLTWQDGYPNVSECPGEEGKPIPETVDPLLNDPDVLQTSTTSTTTP